MKKTIIHFLPSNAKGGMEKMFLYYLKILSNQDYHSIALVSSNFQYFAELNDLAIKHEIIDVRGHYDLFSAFKLLNVIRKNKADIIICHNGRSFAKVNLIRSFLPKNLRDVAICHGGNLKRVMSFNYAITINEYLKKELELKKYRGKIFKLHNFLEKSDNVTSSQKKIKVFGAISRLVKSKNFDFLISAFARQKEDDIKLIIAGDGEEKESLVKLVQHHKIEDKVKFIGWIDNHNEFFAEIDCLIHPSFSEPFGLILLEAMSYKLPVIAANNAGPREIITNGENGLLFEINDQDSLNEKITIILDDIKLKNDIAENGYKSFKDNYSFNAGAQKLLNIMNKING